MLFEIKGICQNCAENVNVLVHNGDPISQCPSCNEDPFEVERIAGVVYVVKNKNQVGVKIGQTAKTVEERIKQLSSTGVAGKFEVVAIFPSTNPKKDEKRAHEKLLNKKLEKEHFDLEPVEAALKVYRVFNKRIMPIFYDDDIKERFYLELEKAKIEMQLKLKGKKV
ncbi:MAG: hypothetical protein ACJAUN_001246 [Alcanivorax sp.]|jgi:hypothetical protein|uniref:GIY-YIG nuclease family protein n=1 Tax=unclassified Alcanivorax TaxID=2638842 RepID=UPI000C9389CE|nr:MULTISPECIES: GIY-YIG nuclease family protein [unclassified Alcanivorax]MAC13342.1 hypothetical protein [Alcanivorax sp.]|tara:strand:- start:215 stop:715 length:501 start_codon:yes stop_codon:yes gene_type:complete